MVPDRQRASDHAAAGKLAVIPHSNREHDSRSVFRRDRFLAGDNRDGKASRLKALLRRPAI